jgi:hypothetical protein
MGLWVEAFRLVGTIVALTMIGTVIAVSLIFEAPSNWPHAHHIGGFFRRQRSDPTRST